MKKRSPRGLFNINEMTFNKSSEDWVLTCIADGEAWARTTLEKAGIQIAAGSELTLTSKRSSADTVHQAAVTLFQARKLREWLEQSQDAGGLASRQAFQSAFRMGQFLFAAFTGTLVEVEPLLDTGRKVRFGGQDGAKAASENKRTRPDFRKLVNAEVERGSNLMTAYKVVARRSNCSISTVRRALR